jgi:hypothetical protein
MCACVVKCVMLERVRLLPVLGVLGVCLSVCLSVFITVTVVVNYRINQQHRGNALTPPTL